jgi:xanthine dehydrogenase iron-sulfur cluster and FAD-binding subunit A
MSRKLTASLSLLKKERNVSLFLESAWLRSKKDNKTGDFLRKLRVKFHNISSVGIN